MATAISTSPKSSASFAVGLLLMVLSPVSTVSASAASSTLAPASPTTGELQIALDKLNVLASVLYVGAHPDDESTALLAYLARGRNARTAYLSLTRGDGGQNLIGTELGPELGLIRTQELLGARRIDGAEQVFTRAIDFGYTKSVDETLEIWGREQVLADVVRIIRRFQPDVIITRFPGDGRGGHGQHTASAVLAIEAFAAAADSQRFPKQLTAPENLEPWQAKRLLWDAARFFGPGPESVQGLSVDIGVYSPFLGQSFTEIAALSRSQHKSQGFGSSGRRGHQINPFEHRLGVEARVGADGVADLFDAVDTSWQRVPGGAEVGVLLAEAAGRFDARRPSAIAPVLLRADALLSDLASAQPRNTWVRYQQAALHETIRGLLGLWLEAITDREHAAPGESVGLQLSAIQRSDLEVRLVRVELPFAPSEVDLAASLPADEAWTRSVDLQIPAQAKYNQPYWLASPADGALYDVDDPTLIGRPEGLPLQARFAVEIAGRALDLEVPLLQRFTDRVEGERYRAFEVAPPLSLTVEPEVSVFAAEQPKAITIVVDDLRAASSLADGSSASTGVLSWRLPAGWSSEPESLVLELVPGSSHRFETRVRPPTAGAGEPIGTMIVEARVDGVAAPLRSRVRTIDYPHIAAQTYLKPAVTRLVRIDLERRGDTVGYVVGAGDEIPQALRQVDYQVTLLSDQDLESADLSGYDAIVVGIRAYNSRPALERANDRLLDYVEKGGTLVVQYNTAGRGGGGPEGIGPYPFRISNDRVSVETAPVSLLLPDHPVLLTPNRITNADFSGWVQERGLYFPDQWDPRYQTPLSSNDPGEPPRNGGLLVAEYGQGIYIYTGYSFFRELPAGVPGAFRLFVNLISARH